MHQALRTQFPQHACSVVEVVSNGPVPCVTGMPKWQYFKEPAMKEQVITWMIACRHFISARTEALTITFKEVCSQCGLISALP